MTAKRTTKDTAKETTRDGFATEEILARVNIDFSLAELVEQTARQFDLGAINKFELIHHGYQDLNVKVETDRGEFIIKVFSKRRTVINVEEQTRALRFFHENGLPVPNLVPCETPRGDLELFNVIYGRYGDACVAVFEFFKGTSFDEIRPRDTDIVYLAGCLARMHKLSFKITGYYDDWGAANLLNEYVEKGELLSSPAPGSKKSVIQTEDRKSIESIVERMQKVDLSKYRQCVIHGDLYRSHALKRGEYEYCIIDFGCMDFNAAILDLAIFTAHFCLDGTEEPAEIRRVIELVEHSYRAAGGTITHAEKEVMPLLMGASYAAYVLATVNLIVAHGDNSKQTKGWLELALRKLRSYIAADLLPAR